MMDDLVTWFRAYLDEEERVARATAASSSGNWHITTGGEIRDSDGIGIIHAHARMVPAELEHIARHDPARVLAEVAAKRRILDETEGWRHETCEDPWYSCSQATEANGYDYACIDEERHDRPCDCGMQRRRDLIQRAMALPCADRPGYRDEWRP